MEGLDEIGASQKLSLSAFFDDVDGEIPLRSIDGFLWRLLR